MATNGISSSGQFINIDALIKNSVKIQQNRLDNSQSQKNVIESKISNIGQIKSQINSLFEKFQAINKAVSNYSISGNSEALEITANDAGTYNVEVKELSSSQITTSNKFSSGALGLSGTLKIEVGNYNESNSFTSNESDLLEISPTDTLLDIQNKINKSGKINASIINSQEGQHLSLSSKSSGKNQAFKLSVDDPSNSGASILNFNQGMISNYKEILQAKDAKAIVNGMTLTSENNQFTGVNNFSFSAKKITGNEVITVEKDNSTIKKAIEDFVTAYNSTSQNLKKSTINREANGLGSDIRALFYSNSENTITQLGLSFDKTGLLSFDNKKFNTLSINDTKLTAVIQSNFSDSSKVGKYFHKQLDNGGNLDIVTNNLAQEDNKLEKNINSLKDLLEQQQKVYANKYATLDAYLSTLDGNSTKVGQLMNQFNKNN